MRGAAILVAVLLAGLPVMAENVHHHPDLAADDEVIIAILDTGIDPDHPQFGSDQIVAWWDFTTSQAGDATWMTSPAPYDDHGHGTCVASTAAGLTYGAYPGAKLAIAKVGTAEGGISEAHAIAAIEWAVEVVGADVISMSFGAPVPIPGVLSAEDEAVRDATNAGALAVRSAGNGVANYGVRYPGHVDNNLETLLVGAVGPHGTVLEPYVNGYYSNTDPDVVAWGSDVPCAKAGGGTERQYGTSFSAPHVAGWAAKTMKAAMDAGQDPSPRRVKDVLTHTAYDLATPYALDGYGFVNGFTGSVKGESFQGTPDTVADAIALAESGAPVPAARIDTEAQAAASQGVRFAGADGDKHTWLAESTDSDEPGWLERSVGWVREGEVYGVTFTHGDRLQVWVNASGKPLLPPDLDVYVWRLDDVGALTTYEAYEEARAVAVADTTSTGGVIREHLDVRLASSGDHVILVTGDLVRDPTKFTIEVRVNGASVTPAYLGDRTLLDAHGVLG